MTALTAIAALAGCATCPPLADVPIRGDDEAEPFVRRELEHAGAEIVPEVCIDHVRVGGLSKRYGRYNTVTHGIRVSKDVWATEIPHTLRHEICHGVDRQNDLVPGREDLFEPKYGPLDWRGAAEGFAERCEWGADLLAPLWSTDCPEVADLRGARVVREEVYGLSDPPPAAWFEPIAGFELGADPRVGRLSATVGGFLYLQPIGALPVLVDPWTGVAVDDDAVDEALEARVDPPVPPTPPLGWELYHGADPTSESGGPIDERTAIVHARMSYANWSLGADTQRFIVVVDGAWAPADGPCPDSTVTFFALEGELWSAQVVGDRLEWGRWHAGAVP